MQDDFRLKVFLALAAERSFTRAAASLKVSQPSVSQNISELEKYYGVRFFERLHGEVTITPAGEAFKEFALEILSKCEDFSRLVRPFDKIVVKVASSSEVFNHLISVLLVSFIKIHPEVTFMMTLMDEEADVRVTLSPVDNERGMMALSYHPSSEFLTTRLWNTLSQFLEPALK